MSTIPNNDAQIQEIAPDNNKGAAIAKEEVKREHKTLVNEENLKDKDIQTLREEKKKAEDTALPSKNNKLEVANIAIENSRDTSVLTDEKKSGEEKAKAEDTALPCKDNKVEVANVACENSREISVVTDEKKYGPDVIISNKRKPSIKIKVAAEVNPRSDLEELPEKPHMQIVNGRESSLDVKNVIEDQSSQNLDEKIEEKESEVKNEKILLRTNEDQISNKKTKKNKAKQPPAVMITSRPPRKKQRGKPLAKTPTVKSSSRTSNRRRSISLATPKVVNRKMNRRGSTGGSKRREEKKSHSSKKKIDENKLYLESHSAQFKRRIKNVKSRLFKETKSFVAYKSARYRESQERRNRVEEIARRTQLMYADRSIDFNKKSKRQRDDIWRRRSTLKL